MTFRLEKVLTIGFCLLWMVLIFIDYWYYHPSYAIALKYFQYFDTMLILSIIGGATFFVIHKKKEHKLLKYLPSGIGIYLLSIIISAVILWTHYHKVSQETLDFAEGMTYLGKISYILLATYFILTASYALGNLFLNGLFEVSFKPSITRIIELAIGITLLSLFFTILAFFNILKIYTILPALFIALGIRWKSTLLFIKATLVEPLLEKKPLNAIGFASFFLLLIFISLNLLANVRPFPFGFDALVLYLNLPNLLSQQGGLIEGYSPYYWSVFIASGQIIFGQLEITISLSIVGGILSLFAIYEITRKWLDINSSLLIASIFYSLPLINYQTFRDVKTDLGLLFIMLSAFLVLIKWLSFQNKEFVDKKIMEQSKIETHSTKHQNSGELNEKLPKKRNLLTNILSESDQLIVILGLLSGMALGIKLTSLIFIFSVLSVFSFIKGGKIGFLANFFLTIFVVLVGELDTTLRAYHFGVANLKWVMLLLGLSGLLYLGYTRTKQFISLVKISVIYILLIAIFYAPWPVKNYQETGKMSIETLIKGK